MGDDWNDLIFLVSKRSFDGAEHLSHRRPVKVAVAEADPRAGRSEGDREIGCDGGLSDAPFAGSHGDHAFDAGNRGFPDTASHSSGCGGGLDLDFNLGMADVWHWIEDRVAIAENLLWNLRIGGLNLDMNRGEAGLADDLLH